jgi:hypothetical protein
MIKKFKKYIKGWWKRHICDTLPETEDEEFSEKYRT